MSRAPDVPPVRAWFAVIKSAISSYLRVEFRHPDKLHGAGLDYDWLDVGIYQSPAPAYQLSSQCIVGKVNGSGGMSEPVSGRLGSSIVSPVPAARTSSAVVAANCRGTAVPPAPPPVEQDLRQRGRPGRILTGDGRDHGSRAVGHQPRRSVPPGRLGDQQQQIGD